MHSKKTVLPDHISLECKDLPAVPLLEIRKLSFSYEGSASLVFEGLDLSVSAGEFVLVKGASGSGKSTLLRLICRLNQPVSGSVLFQGGDIAAIAPAKLRSRISYVAQIPQMIEGSVEENLLLPFSYAVNASKLRPDREKLKEMLKAFYLSEVSPDHSAMKLSTGQKQRLAIMRAILQEPLLLLLDEPTSSLDPESAAMVFSIMEQLNLEQQKTLITVMHGDYNPVKVRPRTCILSNRTLHCSS